MHGWGSWNPPVQLRQGESSMNGFSFVQLEPHYVDRRPAMSQLQLVAFEGRSKGIKGSLVRVKPEINCCQFTGKVGNLDKPEKVYLENESMGLVVGLLPVKRMRDRRAPGPRETFGYFVLIGEQNYLVEEKDLDLSNVIESTRST